MNIKKLLLKGGVMLTGLLIMEGMKRGYRGIRNEDPPLNAHSTNFSVSKVLLWTAATSAVVGSAKLLAREFIDRSLPGKQLKEEGS